MKHKRAKKVIQRVFPRAVEAMKLSDWRIEVKFMSGEHADAPKALMSNAVDFTYLASIIQVWDPAYELSDDEIAHTLIHELAHLYTEDLYSIARGNVPPHAIPFIEEKREQLTERIARLVRL